MQFHRSYYQVLVLVLLFVAVVQTRRVIRAAPGTETTGQYMVALAPDTGHDQFEAISEKVRSQSLSSEIHKIEGQFAKVIVAKMSEAEAHKVSINLCVCVHVHVCVCRVCKYVCMYMFAYMYVCMYVYQ